MDGGLGVVNLLEIVGLISRSLPVIILDPIYLFLFGIISFIIYGQYRKLSIMQLRMFGLRRISPLRETLNSLGYGLLGGIIGSVIFVALGITLTSDGLLFVWVTALILMIINPRFLCFSYAGGIVSVIYLIFGFPNINIPSIMGLVAVLHLVEGLLIYFNGHKNPMPVYIKNNNGKVVGGFSLQRFWPLPFFAVLASIEPSSALDNALAMPDWWPLLQHELIVPTGMALIYMVAPVFAGLGYGDISLTSLPEEKTPRSAANLFLYSVVLLFLAVLADKFVYLEIVPALFAPIGHEWMIYRGQQREKNNKSVFTYPDGVMVLDVYPNSPAEKMGLEAGDVILKINDVTIDGPKQLLAEMTPWIVDPQLTVKNVVTNTSTRVVQYKGKLPPLGFIPAPNPDQAVFVVMRDTPIVRRIKLWWSRVRWW